MTVVATLTPNKPNVVATIAPNKLTVAGAPISPSPLTVVPWAGSTPAKTDTGAGGGTPAPTNSNGTSTGGGTSFSDKSNDIALQNAGLNAVDSQTATGLAGVDKALGTITGQYDTEAANTKATYGQNSDTNTSNLQKNKQSTYVNAAQGRQGLFGQLASIGALNGDGITLANRAVQNGANEDLSGASDTYDTNQTNLDTALKAFQTEDDRRRQDAATAAADAKTSVQNQASKSKQSFLSNLANDYAAEGDTANAKKYSDMASALFGDIANTSIPSTNLAYTGAAFNVPTLGNYLINGDTSVNTTPAQGGGLPGLAVTSGNLKKKTA